MMSKLSPLSQWCGSRLAVMALSLLILLGWKVQVQAQGENQILDIQVTGSEGSPSVIITTQRRPDSSVFSLSDPTRVVVDIADAVPSKPGMTAPGRGPVRTVSVQEFRRPDGIICRVNLGLGQVVDFTSEIRDDGVIVHLTPRGSTVASSDLTTSDDPIGAELARMEAGESTVEVVDVTSGSSSPGDADATLPTPAAKSTAGGMAQITGLDFLPYQERSRVRISTSVPVQFETRAAAGGQVVLLLKDADVNEKYRRPLDTSEFPSAIKLISAYPSREEKGVKVAIKLREQVDYHVEQQDNVLYIDFPMPESMAAAAAAAPQGAGTGRVAMGPGGTTPQTAAPSITAGGGATDFTPMMLGSSGQQMNSSTQFDALASLDPTSGGGVVGSYASMATGNNQRFSIDLREADIHNVFRLISSVAGVNIVAGDDVKGKVTVRLIDVPWDLALAVVCQAKSLGVVRIGNVIRVAPLTVISNERRVALEASEANKQLEPLNMLILPLNYASVKEVEKQVKALLTERGRLSTDTRTNTVIVEDVAATLGKIQALVSRLDTRTPEVMIEARVVEASTTFLREFGIQWGGNIGASANTGNPTGLFFPNSIIAGGGLSQTGNGGPVLPIDIGTTPNWVLDLPASNQVGALSLALGSLGNVLNLDARLTAVESMGHGKVISSPRVTTLDNRKASVVQGTKIPYQTSSASGTQVQFINASLTLDVTPHITADGRVFMEVSVSNNRPDFGNQVDGYPSIEVKEAQTEVMVADGDTTVIGGVYTYNTAESLVGLPVLYKLPVIGALFRTKLIREERKELLVFLTPHVIKSEPTGPINGQ